MNIKRKFKKVSIIVASVSILSMSLFLPHKAEACCGAATLAINAQTSSQALQHASLLLRLTLIGDRIEGAVKDSANKINTTTTQTSKLQNQQKKKIFDIENKASKDAICNGGGTKNTNSVLAKDATKSTALLGMGRKTQKDAGNTSGDMVNATLSNDKMQEQRRLLVKAHDDYCSPSDVKAGYCADLATKDLQNADIRVDRFFLDAYDDGKETTKDFAASKLFYQYIVGSDSTGSIPAKLIKENDSAKQLRARQLELAAYGSIPKYILAKVQSERKKSDGSVALGDMLGIKAKNPSLIQILTEFTTTDNASTLQDYGKQSGTKAKTSFFQEKSLRAMGFTNYMLVKQYIQMQELSTLFASKLSSELKPRYKGLQHSIGNLAN